MRVTLDYQPDRSHELEGRTFDLPPLLDIIFDWSTTFSDEDVTIVEVNQEISATIAHEPARLVAVLGIVRNPSSWDVVSRLAGSPVFEECVRRVLEGQPGQFELQVEDSEVAALEVAWNALLASARDGTLRVLPRRPTAQEDELFDLVTSDPNFFSDGIRFLRELYGDEAVDRAIPDLPSD